MSQSNHVYQRFLGLLLCVLVYCKGLQTEKHLFLSQEKMWRRSSRKTATKTAPGVERVTHSVSDSCHRRQEMPREKATVARSWEELGAGRLLQSEGWKQNSFPVFVSRSRLIICRQADRHKICRSESPASWRISPSHMSPIHGPAPSRMGGGAGGGCKPVHKFVCFGVCVSPYASTRMGGWVAGRLPMCPYLLRAGWWASQTILTPAGERERESERLNLLSQDHQPELGDGRACGEGWHGWCTGMVGFHKCVDSMSCLWLNIAGGISQQAKQICCLPPGRVKHRPGTQYMCVHGAGGTRVGAFWCPYVRICIRKSKKKKKRASSTLGT